MLENFEDICDSIKESFSQNDGDPITIITSIEMLCEDVNENGTRKQKENFLELLLSQLQSYPEIVAKIGWDLPDVLLQFFTAENIDVNALLQKSVIIRVIMKCFNEIAMNGSPKECFLTACDMVSNLKISNFENQHQEPKNANSNENFLERDLRGFFFGLELHIIFELLSSSLKRISTLYPSKYLGMTAAAVLKFIENNVKEVDNLVIIMRRIFTLVRGYTPSEIPRDLKENKDIPQDELNAIAEKEGIIQGKLLRSLITTSLEKCLSEFHCSTDTQYFNDLANKPSNFNEYYQSVFDMISRYYHIILSFDVNLEEELRNYLKESKSIYKSLPKDSDISSEAAKDKITKAVYKLAYTYQLQKVAKQTELSFSHLGIFILSAFHYKETETHLVTDVSLTEVIYTYIRITTPVLYCKGFRNQSAEDAARYWVWVALSYTTSDKIREELKSIPSYVLFIFFEMLLNDNVQTVNDYRRVQGFTLLTRLLSMLEEDVSFRFMIDVLQSDLPNSSKSCVLGILKDLMTRKHICQTELSSLSDDISKIDINESKTISSEPQGATTKFYISCLNSRMSSVQNACMNQLTKVCSTPEDVSESLLLLNYLRFFLNVADHWDKTLLNELHTSVNNKINISTDQTAELRAIISANKLLGEKL